MARSPKGTIVQPLPSWNIRQMSAGADGIGPVSLGQIICVGLNNNAQDGSWIVVWDVQVFSIGGGTISSINVIDFNIMQGITKIDGSANQNPGAPLVGAQAQLPGIVWLDIPFGESGRNIYSLSLPPYGYQWMHEWPMAAIMPGQSFAVFSDANAGTDFGATYTWEVVKPL
jgi:hypothetical protein